MSLELHAPYVSIGGTAPVASDGQTVGVGELVAQARRCLGIIQDVLERCGAGLEDAVRTRVLLMRIEDWEAVIKVRAQLRPI